MDKTTKSLIAFSFITLLFFILFFIVKNTDLHSDEIIHYNQIFEFSKGNYKINPALTTIPGYHLLLALLAKITNNSIQFIRSLNLLIGILSVCIFFLIAKKISSPSSTIKSLQYAFLPILFPLFFLVYTDVLSLLLILLSLLFAMQKKYNLAGISGIASILVRQNNIVWLFFIFVFIYAYKNNSFNRKTIKIHLKKSWAFILGFLTFLIFVILNKGIAIGDKTMHPTALSFHFSNIYFMLFIFFFLFLPLNLSNLRRIFTFVKKYKYYFLVLFPLLLIIYLVTFTNTHPYNQVEFSSYLRNKIILYFSSSLYLKILFFAPILFSILSICVTRLKKKSFYLLYPFALLSLLPHWLIEQRYYIVPFTLFILFRETKKDLIEYALIISYAIISLIFFLGIFSNRFFL